jgi:hypothetical protein
MFFQVTGSKQILVRCGFSDYDTYGSGNYAMAATGNLDAPDYIPQGSVRVHNTIKLNAQLSLAHRDWQFPQYKVGCQHDGPESVPSTLFLHRDE